MKKVLSGIAILALATSAFAGVKIQELNPMAKHMKIKDVSHEAKPTGQARTSNLTNHGGPVLANSHLVLIFWGSSWSASDPMVTTLKAFRTNSNGFLSHTSMINQYNAAQSGFVGQADVIDNSNPSGLAVTDAMVQAEVKKWFHGIYDTKAIYMVFIPSGYYSQDGSGTSCGGPTLQYCAYHSHFIDGVSVKYSIEPYPSCSGCQASGFNTNQNAEHFMIHEGREAMTDPEGSAWYDTRGYEADDKCAWSPAPFIDSATGYGYQYEWSNSASGCVK